MPEESLNDTPQHRARKAFENLIAGEDSAIDLPRAALLIAAEEYPDLDIAHYLAQLDLLAERVFEVAGLAKTDFKVSGLSPQNIDPLIMLHAMNKVLFEQEGFHGNHT